MKVGVIGLGLMGSGMAKNLIDKGFTVVVRDIRPEAVDEFLKKGATLASSPRELGSLCDVVITSLPMSPVHPTLENVILGAEGILEGMVPSKIIIDTGNTSPLTAKKINQECQKKGVSFLDAAVSGGPPGAQAGKLTIMVGGLPETFEQVKPILSAIGRRVTYFGPSGSGEMVKSVNNIIVHTTIAIISEALVFSRKLGIDSSKLFETLTSGAAQSWVLDNYGKNMLERIPGHKGVATKDHHERQLSWALQMASELGVPLPITACVEEVFKMSRCAGKKGDWELIIELWEDMTGTFFSKNV